MLAEFLNTESGAVTVDWTLLTAIICGLAIAVVTMLSAAAQEPANALNVTLSSDVVGERDGLF